MAGLGVENLRSPCFIEGDEALSIGGNGHQVMSQPEGTKHFAGLNLVKTNQAILGSDNVLFAVGCESARAGGIGDRDKRLVGVIEIPEPTDIVPVVGGR